MILSGIDVRKDHGGAFTQAGTFPAYGPIAILVFQGFHGEQDYTKGSCLSVVDNPDFDVQNSTTAM
jgi:hypothetical protein